MTPKTTVPGLRAGEHVHDRARRDERDVSWSDAPKAQRLEVTEFPDFVAVGVAVRYSVYPWLRRPRRDRKTAKLQTPLDHRPVYDAYDGRRLLQTGPSPGDPPCPEPRHQRTDAARAGDRRARGLRHEHRPRLRADARRRREDLHRGRAGLARPLPRHHLRVQGRRLPAALARGLGRQLGLRAVPGPADRGDPLAPPPGAAHRRGSRRSRSTPTRSARSPRPSSATSSTTWSTSSATRRAPTAASSTATGATASTPTPARATARRAPRPSTST